MKKAKKLVREIYGGEEYAYYPLGKHIVSCPEVCGGRPTFKYTRILVSAVLGMLSNGETANELVADYRGRLSREAILEAIELAGKAFESDTLELQPAGSTKKRPRARVA
jgi:uncharacterized protein (DUF433 family)